MPEPSISHAERSGPGGTTPLTPPPRSPSKQALLEQRLRKAAKAELTIRRRTPGQVPPLSSGQERLWFVEQLTRGSGAYAIVLGYRLRGELEVASLEAALDHAQARHEALRMRFPADRDGAPTLVIDEPAPAGLSVTDLTTGRLDGAARVERARQIARETAATPFDLAAGPILRRLLIKLGPDDHVLLLVVHHIVADGWSVGILMKEIIDAYAALRDGRPAPDAEMPVQYGDYAVWERDRLASTDGERDLAFWRQELGGVPPLDLAIANPRPAELRYAGATHSFEFDAELTAGLAELAVRQGATVYMTLMAGFQAVLARHSGQVDFAVGSPVAGRPYRELEEVFGAFVNVLAIRAKLADDPAFATIVSRCRDTLLDAMSHQDLPFDRIVNALAVERDPSRSPIFQVSFGQTSVADAAAPASVGVAGPGLLIEAFEVEVPVSHYDLVLYASEQPDRIGCFFTYRTDLFTAGVIAHLAEALESTLRAAVANPDLLLSELPTTSPSERELVLGSWSGWPPEPAPGPSTLTGLIGAQAARTPDAPAIVAGDRSLSHGELDRQANQLARRLRAAGVGPEVPVAICLPASPEFAVAVLAVLKAGGCYLPVDIDQPPDRLGYILADAGARVCLTTAATAVPPEYSGRVLDFSSELTAAATESDTPLAAIAGPGNLAYLIYTSGTTGRPKGVGVEHGQVARYLSDVRSILDVPPGARFALLQSMAFDFAILMFYLPLVTGGCLHLLSAEVSADELAAALAELNIDYLKMTPSHLEALTADADALRLLPARALVLAGEAAPAQWARALAATGRCAIVNSYGPTETVVAVTTHQIQARDQIRSAAAPIGRPMPGVRALVLDERLAPVPPGMAGELYIGGPRLARGYLGQAGVTAERFVADPFGEPGARLYRTGDRVRWLDDGTLDFLGRTDHQVKVRGYRVELGEVAAALARLPGVTGAVADLRGPVGQQSLVGYLDVAGAADGAGHDGDDLRETLAQWLPDYMIPAHFVRMNGFPLQAQGKVDRRALPDPQAEQRPDDSYVPPSNDIEQTIADTWAAVLDVERVGIHDNFFHIGGHSLLATRVVARLRREFAGRTTRPVTVVDMFKSPTVAELAALVIERGGEPAGPRLVHELTGRIRAADRKLSIVCAPYGGANATVFAQLAAAMPAGVSLYAIEVPGHDPGQADKQQPITEVAKACAEEIRRHINGPLVIYGHCGPGGALAVAITQELDAAGRQLEALYLGGVFPFARPTGRVLGPLSRLAEMDRLRGDRLHANWLRGMGSDVTDLDAEQVEFTIRAMREDGRLAEAYFTELLARGARKLAVPVISVVGQRDPAGWFFEERYLEWGFLSDSLAAVLLSEAGHFYVQHRAPELAQILTRTHVALAAGDDASIARDAVGLDATWWLYAHTENKPAEPTPAEPAPAETAPAEPAPAETGPTPGLKRFTAVALGQLVSITGSTLTEFALPLYIFIKTGSLAKFGLLAVVGLVPGILASPLAGAIVDRSDRRRVMMAGDLASGAAEAALLILYLTGVLAVWHIYVLIGCLSVSLAFQRTAYMSAIAQLVPKRYLGHANGMFQAAAGIAQFIAPLLGVALLAAIGLGGILTFTVASYVLAVGVVLFVRFPAAMAEQRAESVLAEITNGLRFTFGQPGFRAMIFFFAALNLFISPLFVLLSPLVLSFSSLPHVAVVAAIAGVGGAVAGLVLSVWGGPQVRRMRGVMLTALLIGLGAILTGLRPSLIVVSLGAFGIAFGIGTANGIIMTIIQTKVPQRIQGRIFALNTMIAAIAVPIGFGVIAPYGTRVVAPLTRLAGTGGDVVRAFVGTGHDRAIGLMYVLCGLALALLVLAASLNRRLARFDADVPDAEPDDLLGLRASRALPSALPALSPERDSACTQINNQASRR